jgi:Ni/Fe-hydrogenase subunit HybB-like protein
MASRGSLMSRRLSLLSFLSLFVAVVVAHEHHEEDLPPGQSVSFDPVDSILWMHIFFMTLSFGILFPTGMVRTMSLGLCC